MGSSDVEKQVEVRNLTGESITVSISPSKTVEELKKLLRSVFPPASSCPNFHLFFKAVKLSLQCPISHLSVGSGEFLVLVPFTKKEKQQSPKFYECNFPSIAPSNNSAPNLVDSARPNLGENLSSPASISRNGNQMHHELRCVGSEDKNSQIEKSSTACPSQVKRKKNPNRDNKEGLSDGLLLSILLSPINDLLDQQNLSRLTLVLESIKCLSNPTSGDCRLWEAKMKDDMIDKRSTTNTSCLCPSWLKNLMTAFTLLNLYSAFQQLRYKKLILSDLHDVMEQLGKSGFQISVLDIKHLSMLFPKVVHIAENDSEATEFYETVVIFQSLIEDRDQLEKGKRRVATSKIIKTLKKRESSFQADFWSAISSLMCKNELSESISLEDLLVFVTKGGSLENGSGEKRARTCFTSSSSCSFEGWCQNTDTLSPAEMLEHLKMGFGSQGQVVHVEKISARKAKYVEIPTELLENSISALKRIGISRLYSHQAESIQATLSNKNVVIATMTSSGKSLCYNLPVLEVLSRNLSACALYLFPTKALAQDQLRSLLAMTDGCSDRLNISVYDGDTPQKDRIWIRDNARLLITNPDMLHVSILPFHGTFRRLLSNLRFVVIDEAHTYKGAFGCHTAFILRRLRRLCSHVYGSNPSFIFSTATSSNPVEHAKELANLEKVELIQNDGSPSGPKLFLLWNPPLRLKSVLKKAKVRTYANKSADKDIITARSSPIMEVANLFAEMIQHGLRCITFCKTRKLCELVLCYTREILQKAAPHLVNSVCAYRGGYIAEDRRRIESDFFSGNICGIAATNALELGIDVGHIDVTLHLGFPGSIASLWQQAGRSGRREKPSLAIYVAFEGPLDQYFMKVPQKLFKGPIECCHIDSKNQQVLQQHLVCAALEHPLSLLHDETFFGPGLEGAIGTLKNGGSLSNDLTRDPSVRIWSYIGHEKSPSHTICIRAIETERYKVIDMQKNEVLEEIEESRAFFQVYEGAVYMNQGRTYLVKNLDLGSKIAWCQEADLKYYTKTRDYTDIHVTSGKLAYPARITTIQHPRTTAQAQTCKVTTTWFGFRRIWKRTNEVFDTVELSLPNYSYESQAVWVRVPQTIKTAVENLNYSFRGGLHAAGHAMLNVVPLYVIFNQSDLASECINPYDTRYVPERILLYDPHPGGTGITAKVQPLFTDLLTAALELLRSCQCSVDYGCPHCVQNIACREYNEVLHKHAAIMIIKGVLEAEESYFKDIPSTADAS